MKSKIILFFIIIISESIISQTQDTIRGRVISSISKQSPQSGVYITEKGTYNSTIADSLGVFKLVPKTVKNVYELEIIAGNYKILSYKYKAEWMGRKYPKSIVVNADCENNISEDWKNGKVKLFIIGGIAPIENLKSDNRFEKKYNLKYWDFGCDAQVYECLEQYNRAVFLRLDLKYGSAWRNRIRKDVVGLN